MMAIDYLCPRCGIHAREMEVTESHPKNSSGPYKPTPEEMAIVAERLQQEPHADYFATRYWYCFLCDEVFTFFQMKRTTFEGSVEAYISNKSGPFPEGSPIK